MKKIPSRLLAVAATTLVAVGAAFTGTGAASADSHAHDLEPFVTVSDAKAPGFAGLAAIRVKNVGTERYYGDFPAISFTIQVKTDRGPEGVDRLITPGWFNGAYTRDLGFDEKTSTRTFEVSLSNPVNKGDEQLIANLNFGDGNTKEGRLKNYITITQNGRLADDTSTFNDQDIDSRATGVTRNDFGKESKSGGIF